jgi:circadian clock protein KaiB
MRLRLYIAGAAPNSRRALANLKAMLDAHGPEGCHLEVVDVLLDTQRALTDRVLVTPTLKKLSPAPTAELVGDLSEHARVLQALGIA